MCSSARLSMKIARSLGKAKAQVSSEVVHSLARGREREGSVGSRATAPFNKFPYKL